MRFVSGALLVALGLLPLNAEQRDCLADPSRIGEAADMLEDLAARCGVRLPAPQEASFGPFETEEEARADVDHRVGEFEAITIEAVATDDSRGYGADEYYVTGFNGPEGAVAARSRGSLIALWVGGQEQSDW